MDQSYQMRTGLPSIDTRTLTGYLIAFAAVYVAVVVYSYLEWRPIVAYVAVGVPVALYLVTQPRLALYQFEFVLFIQMAVVPSVPLFLIDVSALLLIASAAVDMLMADRLPRNFPVFSINFGFLFAALVVAGAFGYAPTNSVRPLARVVFIVLAFMATVRLASKVGVTRLLKVYFWLCVAHSVMVAGPFLLSGGRLRAFGLTRAVFDDLSMIALPIGLALYIWSRHVRGRWYLVGSAIVLVALVATQSRAPILFGVAISAVVMWLSWSRAKLERKGRNNGASDAGLVRTKAMSRVRLIVLSMVGMVVVALTVLPEVFGGVIGRFERLFTTTPGGSFAIRIVLWKTAWTAFLDHPLLGVGPGVFKSLPNIYPLLHLEPLHVYVQSLSAHNLLLHYLAETGLVGASALMALFINQFRYARRGWKAVRDLSDYGVRLALYSVGITFLFTTIFEAGWMWGQTGFVMAFFLGLLAVSAGRHNSDEPRPGR